MWRGKAALAGTGARLRSAPPWAKVVLTAAAGLSAAVLAGLAASGAGFVEPAPSRPGGATKAAANVLEGRRAPVPQALLPRRPARPARRGDQAALAFVRIHDPERSAHVTEVVWTGPMLRVYTDLPAADADSRTAIALCETAAEYARAQDRIPEVFVHAARQAGYPVLANKMGDHDGCRLSRVP